MNWNKQNPYLAKITSKKLLSGKQSKKEVFHYEISLGDSGIIYQPGDSIGIFPVNNSTLVRAIINRLQINPNFKNLKIIPINIGRDSIEKSKNFYKKLNINNLGLYFDKDVELANKFLLRGLPTTVFINKKGEEFARVTGFIDFDNKKIIKSLQKYD